jgi:septal ring factor EnvC (AmiA/AmiB activator)
MNDTPRTNAILTAILETHGHVGFLNCPPAWVAFARELERELNAANAEVERLTRKVAELYEGAEEQRQEIKSLRNQIDRMIGWKNEKDRQLCNLLNLCRSNGIKVSSQDLLNGREEA